MLHKYLFCPNEVLEPLWPSKISQTILFSKPINLIGGKMAQIWVESQFLQILGIPDHSAPVYLAVRETYQWTRGNTDIIWIREVVKILISSQS